MDQLGRRDDEGDYASDAAAEGWKRGAEERAQYLGPITGQMLDLAGVGPGQRVLDVAAGTGEQTLLAAHRVGPTGRVVAIDISAPMLGVAAESARQAGLANVETRVMDARVLDLESNSFDAVISRMGIMLMPEREKALAEILRVLKPGAKFAAIVWSTAERNLSSLLPQMIARRHAMLPSPTPGEPGMFALGAPGLLERTLSEAGFNDVSVRAVPAPRAYASSGEMMRYMTTVTPMLREPLSKLDETGRAALLAEIEATMQQFAGSDCIVVRGEVLVGVGTM
jgi:ubiquinone/menaquinone biosynthesis C-methylase UbiE